MALLFKLIITEKIKCEEGVDVQKNVNRLAVRKVKIENNDEYNEIIELSDSDSKVEEVMNESIKNKEGCIETIELSDNNNNKVVVINVEDKVDNKEFIYKKLEAPVNI